MTKSIIDRVIVVMCALLLMLSKLDLTSTDINVQWYNLDWKEVIGSTLRSYTPPQPLSSLY